MIFYQGTKEEVIRFSPKDFAPKGHDKEIGLRPFDFGGYFYVSAFYIL